MYRQGDILIIPVTFIPPNATSVEREHGQIILAYGEATGHAHAIADADVELLAVSDRVDRWLRVRSQAGVTVVHAEHGKMTIPAGAYRVVRQREYEPEAIRYVAD